MKTIMQHKRGDNKAMPASAHLSNKQSKGGSAAFQDNRPKRTAQQRLQSVILQTKRLNNNSTLLGGPNHLSIQNSINTYVGKISIQRKVNHKISLVDLKGFNNNTFKQ